MTDWQIVNARIARERDDACSRALIVTGSDREANFWKEMLATARIDATGDRRSGERSAEPLVVSERGRKGNFLGTLQAFSNAIVDSGTARAGQTIEQIVMFIGSGTRLSPYTQALGNMKSAFPLPDADAHPRGYTVGEAAIRSTAACIESLRHGGFDGVVMRWGDEILIPSTPLTSLPDQYADVDVVRFGWRTEPTEALANQKEWLVVDPATGLVLQEIGRQPLSSVQEKLARSEPPGGATTFVNLGSFAASNVFLRELSAVFGAYLGEDSRSVNWDPYFWVAFQCESAEEWQVFGKEEQAGSRSGFRELESAIPNFFELAQAAKRNLRTLLGRDVRTAILDFGEPYWLDAGNHQSLQAALGDLFRNSRDGDTLRAFLGLPEELARGDSFVKKSTLAPGVVVNGSIVIDAEIRDPRSVVDGAIVLRGAYGRLEVGKGGMVIWSRAEDLTVAGPHGCAFRFSGDRCVSGDESVSTIRTESGSIQLRYVQDLGTIDADAYTSIVAENPISFRDASALMAQVDPLRLQESWERETS